MRSYLEPRTCDIDGCKAVVQMSIDPYMGDVVVSHGGNKEAVRTYGWTELFVETGYAPWVRAVHDYEGGVEAAVVR